MKRSFYQWLTRTVLALVCLLTTTSAWAGFNIYVNSTSGDFYIYMWNGGTSNGWPGNKLNSYSTTTINNKTWYVIPISGSSTNYILNNGSGNQTPDGYASSDIYLNYSGGKSAEDVTNEMTNTPDTWTVAGEPAALFGTTWDAGNTDNDMIETSNGILTWSKENVTLSQGTVKFKVVKNHNWGTAYPGSDYELSIPSNGTYNVIITFNSDTQAVNATATAVQTTPDVYYVAGATNGTASGSNDALFGTAWNATSNVMTTTDDTHYTWTSGQATLSANDVVEFKVVKNGNEWIGNNGNNITCTATQNGIYTFTVAYTVGDTPTGTLNLIAEIPDAPTFSPAAGSYSSNQSVTLSCATSGAVIYYTTDGSNPTTSSTVYSGEITLTEGTTTIKAVAVKDGNSSAQAEATYTIVYDRYYVVGEPNTVFPSGWSIGDQQLMTTSDNATYTWTKTPLTLAADAVIAYKVKKKDVNGETWIPDGANLTVSPTEGAGDYTLTITYNPTTGAHSATLTPLFATRPVFTPSAGNYDTNQTVTITTADGGTIYYTTDGTDPTDSETRIAYTGPISVAGEGEHVIKAVSVNGGETSDVVTAEYVIKYQNIYLFGSVGKAHAWVFNYNNPELVTSDGVNYSGVANVNVMTDYHRSDNQPVGLFMLTKGFGSNWETTEPMMIGTTSTTEDNHYWIDGGSGHFGEWLDTRPGSENAGNGDLHTNGWSLPAGTYEFFYNGDSKQLMVTAFDGPTIYVYDYTRPYIYVEDKDGKPFDGVQPGNPIQILDETVGGHSGLSTAGDGTGDGNGTLGWYKFSVPSNNYPFHFQFHHNGDKKVIDSPFYEDNAGDVYYYWDGAAYQPIEKANTDKLRRIVAHVRVQGTTVPTCDNQPMNGPSSFYGQMYYWMAVTTYDKGENVVISDGKHHYEGTIYSDIYLEWADENASTYNVLSQSTLENRLATKTGRGTVIHLLKNKNTPTNNGDYVLGIDTEISSNGTMYNSTNVGTTWWGNSITSPWAGTESWHNDQNTISNYNNSRFLYAESGKDGNPDVYTITAENGTEWYTWYSDRSTATIKFGYGTPKERYPNYLTGDEGAPENPENVYKFYANYESPQTQQTAGELWYVWTPDFNAELNEVSQNQNNGELIDVTRTYESRAKQKALCSTFRDGNYVYYTDIKGWGDNNVYCYAWTVPGLVWPGVQMVKVGYDDEGHPVYLADLSNFDVSNATGIIFNNGHEALETDKRQTGDLPFENQGCYDYLGLLYRIGGNVDVIENEPDGFPTSVTLTGVWYSRVKGTLLAKGNNDYNNKSVNGMGYKDFAKTVNDGNDDGTVLQSRDYDQSNWVEIYPSEDGLVNAETLIDLIGKPFTLYGTKTNSVNPTFTAISVSNVGAAGKKYQPNHFTPIHLNGSCYQYRHGEKEWYFFVEPKPNEFAIMDWAAYHEDSDGHEYFYTPSNTGFDGEFVIDWSYFDKFNPDGEAITALAPYQMDVCGKYPGENYLHEGVSYKGWYAIVKANQAADPAGDVNTKAGTDGAGKYTVCPVYINDEQIMTAIEDINVDGPSGERTLKATRYYNMMGVESSTPFQGVNIIVREYSDGSRESSKVIMR